MIFNIFKIPKTYLIIHINPTIPNKFKIIKSKSKINKICVKMIRDI